MRISLELVGFLKGYFDCVRASQEVVGFLSDICGGGRLSGGSELD